MYHRFYKKYIFNNICAYLMWAVHLYHRCKPLNVLPHGLHLGLHRCSICLSLGLYRLSLGLHCFSIRGTTLSHLLYLLLEFVNVCILSIICSITNISADIRQLSWGDSNSIIPHSIVSLRSHQLSEHLGLDATILCRSWGIINMLRDKRSSSLL